MKVTIDSSEPLADALRVISSMYDVTLAIADGSPATVSAPRPSKRVSPAASNAGRGRGKRSTADARGTVDPKLVRQWAWENGHEVNARGSLPAAVRDAYRAATQAEPDQGLSARGTG